MFVTFYGVLYVTLAHVVAVSRMPEDKVGWFLIMLFLSMVIIPMLGLGLMFKKFTSREWEAMSPNERGAASISMGFIYIALFYIYRNYLPDDLIGSFILAAGIASILAGLLQRRMKVSFHMMGMAGVLVLILFMARDGVSMVPSSIPTTIVLLLTGIVAWSRLMLKAHSPVEIYLGYSVGLLSTIAVFIIQYGL